MEIFKKPLKTGSRIWELDFLRGIALLLMVYFHIIFDARDLYGYNAVYGSGINYYIGKVSAILFMLIAGASCTLSRSNVKRGLKVLGVALAITVVTHLFDPAFGIKFGILHFLSVCMLLSPLLIKINKYVLVLLGAAVIAAGQLIAHITVNYDWFFIFGLYTSRFISSDYYPLIPWMGVFIFGLAAGKFFYTQKQSLFRFSIGKNPVSFVGRHTLLVYILHQPLIVGAFELIKLLK